MARIQNMILGRELTPTISSLLLLFTFFPFFQIFISSLSDVSDGFFSPSMAWRWASERKDAEVSGSHGAGAPVAGDHEETHAHWCPSIPRGTKRGPFLIQPSPQVTYFLPVDRFLRWLGRPLHQTMA